jgi:hypothetical protein
MVKYFILPKIMPSPICHSHSHCAFLAVRVNLRGKGDNFVFEFKWNTHKSWSRDTNSSYRKTAQQSAQGPSSAIEPPPPHSSPPAIASGTCRQLEGQEYRQSVALLVSSRCVRPDALSCSPCARSCCSPAPGPGLPARLLHSLSNRYWRPSYW